MFHLDSQYQASAPNSRVPLSSAFFASWQIVYDGDQVPQGQVGVGVEPSLVPGGQASADRPPQDCENKAGVTKTFSHESATPSGIRGFLKGEEMGGCGPERSLPSTSSQRSMRDFLPCQVQIPTCPPRPLFPDTNLIDANDWLVQL